MRKKTNKLKRDVMSKTTKQRVELIEKVKGMSDSDCEKVLIKLSKSR